jgi:SNF2 family DNA or RNA helicase
MLGINVVALRSNMSQEERTKQIDLFNDPRSNVKVMLFTSALGSISVNLQSCASQIIIIEIPINFYLLVQILGRVNRIGQTRKQKIWMPWID